MRFWGHEVRTDSICLNRGFPRIMQISRMIGRILLHSHALEFACIMLDR